MNFTEEEIEVVKTLMKDWGWEYSLQTDRDKLIALAQRIGYKDWRLWE